jgi:HSP20 family protein
MANRDLTSWRGQSTAWPSFQPFLSLRQEMDRLFDDFIAPTTTGRAYAAGDNGNLCPCVELKENDKAYTVTVELPGLEMKDVHVDLRDNVLAIGGEKKDERQGQEAGTHYSERLYGRFERRIPLTQEVDAEKVEAKFRNGLLSVELPKNPRAQEATRHIQIKPN